MSNKSRHFDSTGLRSLASDSAAYTLARAAPSLTSLLLTLMLVRVLGLSGFGHFAIYWSVSAIVVTLAGGWLRQWILRSSGHTSYQLARSGLVRSSYLIFPAAFILPCWLLLRGSVWGAVAAYFFALSATYQSVSQGVLQAEGKVGRIVVSEVGRNAGIVAVLGALALMRLASVASVLAVLAISAYLAHLYQLRCMGPETINRVDALPVAWRYGWPISAWLGVAALLQFSDRIVIEALASTSDTGVYSSLYDVLNRGTGLLVMPITMALHPRYMKSINETDTSGADRMLRFAMVAQISIAVLASGALAFVARDLTKLIVGMPVPNSLTLLLSLTAGGFLWHFAQLAHKPLEAGGRTGTMLTTIGVCFTVNAGANVLLIPVYGYQAAAWTTLGSSGLYLTLVTIAGRRRRALPGGK